MSPEPCAYALRYDPEDTLSYGYSRCPQCETTGYGLDAHDVGCPKQSRMEFWMGARAALAILTGRGNKAPMAITAAHVRDAFPDLCRHLEQQSGEVA